MTVRAPAMAPDAPGSRGEPSRDEPSRDELDAVYRALLEEHGPQRGWWPHAAPAGSEPAALEICAGAILTQHTAWRGAAAAIERLRAAGALCCDAMASMPPQALADLVRPAGHPSVKALRLRAFARTVLEEHGGAVRALLDGEPEDVRERLLAIAGVGPETADAMLLYAAGRPAFVVDAYALRLFERFFGRRVEGLAGPLAGATGARRYERCRRWLLDAIGPDAERLGQWHALIVRHGQRVCRRSAPRCGECVLLRRCAYGRGGGEAER